MREGTRVGIVGILGLSLAALVCAANARVAAPPPCTTGRPNVVSLTLPHESLPCLDNVFTVGVQTDGILGPITYVWRRYVGDLPVELTDGGRISGSRTPVMTIANLQQEDYGVYDVVVSNPCGPVTSGRTSVTPPVGTIEQWSSLPAPRASSAMAFDRGRGRMVFHGGWWETLTPEGFIDAFIRRGSATPWGSGSS